MPPVWSTSLDFSMDSNTVTTSAGLPIWISLPMWLKMRR